MLFAPSTVLRGDVDVPGAADAGIARVHGADGGDEIHIPRRDAWVGDDGADAAAGHGAGEIDGHLPRRWIDRYDGSGRGDRGLRTASGIDVARGRPNQNIAPIERERCATDSPPHRRR